MAGSGNVNLFLSAQKPNQDKHREGVKSLHVCQDKYDYTSEHASGWDQESRFDNCYVLEQFVGSQRFLNIKT